MKMTKQGLDLIKRYEGFVGNAYLCPANVWTIGYGHTSAAGSPMVSAGKTMTKAEADKVLGRDIAKFASGVSASIRVALSDSQFSALVSFAYNVGLGAFRSSSVLRAVNSEDHDAVPRRLNLWVKAGGRTLAGLVKRRASEGAVYASSGNASHFMDEMMFALPSLAEIAEMNDARGLIDAPTGKSFTGSTTNIAAMLQGAGGAVMAAVYGVKEFLWGVEISPQAYLALLLGGVIIALAYYIISQRLQKAADYDV